MRLYTYIVSHDTGFAPNPFWGYCTLACCKPAIRRTAQKGDWIVGISPKSRGHRLVYAMEVTQDPIDFAAYFNDPRFEKKKPDYRRGEVKSMRGDNIYRPLGDGRFKQLRSRHSMASGAEDLIKKGIDLKGRNVLISDHFYYFGSKAIALPESPENLVPGRGHKCRFSDDTIRRFLEFIRRNKPGLRGRPLDWPEDDKSCGC